MRGKIFIPLKYMFAKCFTCLRDRFDVILLVSRPKNPKMIYKQATNLEERKL